MNHLYLKLLENLNQLTKFQTVRKDKQFFQK